VEPIVEAIVEVSVDSLDEPSVEFEMTVEPIEPGVDAVPEPADEMLSNPAQSASPQPTLPRTLTPRPPLGAPIQIAPRTITPITPIAMLETIETIASPPRAVAKPPPVPTRVAKIPSVPRPAPKPPDDSDS
ncbi:MAG: hypothetical protein NT062_39390, partial [Proteobacteria bacterium]|nr:hypothetical protein [Pseudomonadota bacterium]